jgi:hypothetical protein
MSLAPIRGIVNPGVSEVIGSCHCHLNDVRSAQRELIEASGATEGTFANRAEPNYCPRSITPPIL